MDSPCHPRPASWLAGDDAHPPRAAYIHVPFCAYRCGYCDFAIAVGRDDLVEPYLDAVATELSWLGSPREVDTLYFGGGTPSYLSLRQLARLCSDALRWHPLAAGHEWTVEANPEHFTGDQVALLADRGATRISLGVQSLRDEKLRVLERKHSRREVLHALDLIERAGLAASIDLMFAAPGESLDDWREELRQAIALGASHISTYGLTWEHGTSFTQRRDRGELRSADEELERAMYAEAIDALVAAGYEHYEVSNFARPGSRSRHNEVYWAGQEYFAAGPGAARYVAGVRETNIRSTPAYIRRVLVGESPAAEREELAPPSRARELLVLGLRRMRGIARQEFAAATGLDLDELAGSTLARFVAQGWLHDDGDRLRLTRQGLYISDALWPELI